MPTKSLDSKTVPLSAKEIELATNAANENKHLFPVDKTKLLTIHFPNRLINPIFLK
jgi:hypothetical protein